MRFETSQFMKMGQTMRMAPRMIQSMEILQMPLAELEERIEQELESNPTLELADGPENRDSQDGEQGNDDRADGVDSGEDASFADDGAETVGESRAGDALSRSGDHYSGDELGDDIGNDINGNINGDIFEGDEPARHDESADEFSQLDRFEEVESDAAENEFGAADSFDRDVAHEQSERYERELRYEEALGEYGARPGEVDAKSEAMAAAPARGASLTEQLRGQWSLSDVDPMLRAAGEVIISFVEDDGYVRTSMESIIDRSGDAAGLTVPLLERAIIAVQRSLEPAGVAARTAGECLLLQLDSLEEEDEDSELATSVFAHARVLVRDHLEDLMQNRLPKVSEQAGLTLAEIKSALGLLKRLSLAPARRLVNDAARPITPDAIVEYDADQDRYFAYLNDRRLPNVRVNQEYARLAKDRTMDRKGRDFIKVNLGNAQWLLDAVGQRRNTLLRVTNAVVAAQREFFDYGPASLKPLPMQTIADQLGIHVATVSRAVAEKYIATPRGVVPLRKFFSGGVQTRTTEETVGGEDMAWEAVKASLQELIQAEDKKKPLSDEALAGALKAKGIDIARRTVAKYREQLGIPAKRLRQLF